MELVQDYVELRVSVLIMFNLMILLLQSLFCLFVCLLRL
jgi:hypothetical protein